MLINDKPFDKVEFNRSDAKGKQVAAEILMQLGFENIRENLEESNGKFDKIWDVCGEHPMLGVWRIDAEVKWDWGLRWENFRYDTVSFPGRKRDKTKEHSTHHLVCGGDFLRAFLVTRNTVLTSPVISKRCKNRNGLEPFFNVSVHSEYARFMKKVGNVWKVVPYGTV